MSVTADVDPPKVHHQVHRRNLSLPQASLQAIDDLRNYTDAVSDSEVIRKALKLYQTLVTQQHEGAEIFLRKGGIDKALVLV